MFKLTKQGVRDLSHLKGPPQGVKLEEPPKDVIVCKKHKLVNKGYFNYCTECGAEFETLKIST